jgi:hypothetical protein
MIAVECKAPLWQWIAIGSTKRPILQEGLTLCFQLKILDVAKMDCEVGNPFDREFAESLRMNDSWPIRQDFFGQKLAVQGGRCPEVLATGLDSF